MTSEQLQAHTRRRFSLFPHPSPSSVIYSPGSAGLPWHLEIIPFSRGLFPFTFTSFRATCSAGRNQRRNRPPPHLPTVPFQQFGSSFFPSCFPAALGPPVTGIG
ncbi:Hypothetical protein NTJ_02202 [Nesidiocoris tenuis]|uniref:Uncharacterized protein n=1 Tax=Nesidiocoris tenuis TaxID=355587 RepID=A0ABN7AAQ3_9HEMI|nr:Hypothetical protein NTJ_02202 [Nesidiocoris tenuis]